MKIKRFNEKNLNLSELDNTDKENVSRGQKFVQRLKKGNDQNFTILKNEKPPEIKDVDFINADEVVDNITSDGGQYNKEKSKQFFTKSGRYQEVLKDEDGKVYKLKDIKKDVEFGSGKGSSLGLDETRLVESIQCLFFSLRQFLKRIIIEDDIKEFFDEFELDENGKILEVGDIKSEILLRVNIPIVIDVKTLLNSLNADKKHWVNTFIDTSNALYDQKIQLIKAKKYSDKRTILLPQKTYDFHQIGSKNSKLVEAIDAGYKNPMTEGIPISKWAPSDVWAVSSVIEGEVVNELRGCADVKELNEIVNLRFRERNLVGISLKKVGGKESIKLIVNKLTTPPNFEFNRVVTSTGAFDSLGVRLEAKVSGEFAIKQKETLYLRSFGGKNKNSSISGEIDGAHSKFGKIGLGWINLILNESGVSGDELIPNVTQINKDVSLTDDVLKGEIRTMNDMIPRPDKVRVTQKSISGRAALISKYQALRFAVLMHRLSESGAIFTDDETGEKMLVVDKVTQDIFYYALAIKNYVFECPMYVRIVSN